MALAKAEAVNEHLRLELDELHEARSVLEDAVQKLVAIYDGSPIACLTLDDTGRICEANLPAAELFQRDRVALIGASAHHFLGGGRSALVRFLARARRTPSTSEKFDFRQAKGQSVDVYAFAQFRKEPRPAFGFALVEAHRIDRGEDERERLIQAERVARQANVAKDHFIAALSHELRTPLTPVLAAATALRKGDFRPDQLHSIYELIARNVGAEARLIDDLLDVTRITRGKLKLEVATTDVHHIVTEALTMLAERLEAKHHRLVIELDANARYTCGDAGRLRQVFWNLIGNAVKFTPVGGTIGVRSWNHANELAIEVSDDGDGIDSDTLGRIFEPFEQGERHKQSRAGGLGLGLAISKGVVALHSGRISATSPGRGKGSRFVVELATVPDPKPSHAPPPEDEITQTALELPKPRVLLVEDDPDSAEALEMSLEGAGYEVIVAHSGKQALAANLMNVDLVVSDIGLPDMTGHDFVRALHQTHPIPAIALSGYGTERDIQASKSAGFVLHLTKPVELDALVEAIQKAMLIALKPKSGAGLQPRSQ